MKNKLKEFFKNRIRFNLQEISGAMGDIGTDFPLLSGFILFCGFNATNVFFVFGIFEIVTGFLYGIPMALQPLKVVSAIAISNHLKPEIVFGAGFSIGIIMLLLTLTKTLNLLQNVTHRSVIRGIQIGLGCQLILLSVRNYIFSKNLDGLILALLGFLLLLLFGRKKRFPLSLILLLLGFVYSLFINGFGFLFKTNIAINLPTFVSFGIEDVFFGFITLAIVQIPLSIGNSILATQQLTKDYFPEKEQKVEKIGFTYSIFNLIAPFLGGVPVCHGSGGLAGHYAFGARSGGSCIIYGGFYLFLSLFFSGNFETIVKFFPLPILGIILSREGFNLVKLIYDKNLNRFETFIAIFVGTVCVFVPYGYFYGMILGIAISQSYNFFVKVRSKLDISL